MKLKSTAAKPTKRFWFESYRWFRTSEGFLVLGGRDAATNEKLVKKQLEDEDRYIHADIHGAPSIVIKAEGKPITDRAIEEACAFAVGTRRWPARTNSSSAKISRSLARAWLMADALRPRRSAARVTLASTSSASRTTRRLASTSFRCMI